MMKELLIVGLGSFFGGASRYGVSLLMKGWGGGFPWATLTVNLLGCLLIGVLYGYFGKQAGNYQQLSLFLTVGFCGGFTTFSTFSRESLSLMQGGNYLGFGIYVLASVVIGIAAVAAGYWITK